MITYTCAFCQTVFTAKRISVNKKQYCSVACGNKNRPKAILTNQCRQCLKFIYSNRHYCGIECKTIAIEERALKKLNTPKKLTKTSQKLTKAEKNEYANQRAKKIKLRAVEYKGGKCQCCGYNQCVAALDFHHVDPTKKEKNIAQMNGAWENIKIELDKCILVCSNCHREIHTGFTKIPEQFIEITPLAGIEPTLLV